jgi:GNAT superfamily N-acetyltransferase
VIHEQPVTELPAFSVLFPGPQLAMVIAAIAAGNTAGRFWTVQHGKGVFLWDQGNNVFYLGGAPLASDAVRELAALIANDLQPLSVMAGARYFRTRGLNAELDALIPRLFAGVALAPAEKRFYAYSSDEPPAVARPEIAGLSLVPIDMALLQSGRENVRELLDEISWMWPGSREQAVSHFLTAGLGSAAVLGSQIVCWCTAEYVSAARCGIGIETEAGYRRRGIATATTAHFIAAALSRGLRPYWECDSANLPSVRVAERVGFQLVETAHFWAGSFPPGEPG